MKLRLPPRFGPLAVLAALSIANPATSQTIYEATLATEGGELRDLYAAENARAEDTGTVTLRVSYPFGMLPFGVSKQELAFAWRVGQGDGSGYGHDVNLRFDEDLWYHGEDDGTITVLSNASFAADGEALITLPLGLGSAVGGNQLYPRFVSGGNELEISLGWAAAFHLSEDGLPAGTLTSFQLPVVCDDAPLLVLPNSGRSVLYLDEAGNDWFSVSQGESATSSIIVTLDVVPSGAVTLTPSVFTLAPGEIVEVDIDNPTLGEFSVNASDSSGGDWRGPTMEVVMPPIITFDGPAGMPLVEGGRELQSLGEHSFSKCSPASAAQPGRGGGTTICQGPCSNDCSPPSCSGDGESDPGHIVREGKCYGIQWDDCHLRDDMIVFSHPWRFSNSLCSRSGCPRRKAPGGNVWHSWEKPCCDYKVDPSAPPVSVTVRDCYE